MGTKGKIGFTCAYTPLPLIDAAGFAPYRILPMGDAPDQSGHLLHDNLCPTIKRILDRALSGDLPDLDGVIFINSCDAMRRMADAWRNIRKDDRIILLDLPATRDNLSIDFLKQEFMRLTDTLGRWCGKKIEPAAINQSIDKVNEIAQRLAEAGLRIREGKSGGGSLALQTLYNEISAVSFDEAVSRLTEFQDMPDTDSAENDGVPVFLFGNVMCDPEAFEMITSCGAFIANDDFCTGSRMFSTIGENDTEDVHLRLAKAILSKPPCARTFDPATPGKMATDILNNARACNAQGVIGHTIKFCDPYLERLPLVREKLKGAGMPLLLLEGDCTLRSMGQQKTRIEAFIEMLR